MRLHPEPCSVATPTRDHRPRVFYGQGREYLLLIDKEGGDADPYWYTKFMYQFFKTWYPRYDGAKIAYYKDLPTEFLAVEDDGTKTFDWIFEHEKIEKRLLGALKPDPEAFGERGGCIWCGKRQTENR